MRPKSCRQASESFFKKAFTGLNNYSILIVILYFKMDTFQLILLDTFRLI